MSWSEFCSLLSGIMPETPLGRVVSIRAEKDPKIIKNFTKEQKKIRNDWIIRRNKKLMKRIMNIGIISKNGLKLLSQSREQLF